MSEHTPGKLMLEEVVSDSGHIKHLCPVDVDGLSLLTVVEHEGVKFAAVYSDDDARRLVACWNACIGAPTEDLESHGFLALRTRQVESLEAERDSLRAVNAELMEALEGLVEAEESMRATYTCEYGKTSEDEDHFGHEKWAGEFLLERADAARAAITKARAMEGEQG